MEFNLTNFLPSSWLHAVGATLFHSLWLGVILSFIVALILFSTRNTSARMRYNLLTASLCFFMISIAVLFCRAVGALSSSTSVTSIISGALNNRVQAGHSELTDSPAIVTGFNQVMIIWNTYSSQIVIIWFLIICIKSVQLLVGLNGVRDLKNNEVYAAGQKWDEKMLQLSERLGITQKVSILQSGIAKVPMVVGHFKPLILIPLGLLNGLADNEVEAILCHELAHVKRRDYLVNLMQSFIEVVFFFNPAVLWISKLIREERENCCDDLAVSQLVDKRSYVKALITCQEFQLNAPALAMAVTGRKNHLFNRISRMLFDTKTTLNKIEKTILTVALVSVVVCSAAFKNISKAGKSVHTPSEVKEFGFQDSTKKRKVQVEIDRKLAINDAKQAMIDSKQAMIDSKQAIEDAKTATEDAKIAAEDAELAKQDALQADIDAKIANEEAKMLNNMNAIEAAKIVKEHASKVHLDAKFAAEHARQAQIDAKMALKNAALSQKNTNNNYNIPQTPVSPAAPLTPPAFQSAPPLPPEAGNWQIAKPKKTTKTASQRIVESVSSTDSDKHDYKSIIAEMIRDGLIQNQDKLSYKLDKNTLIVNGVKQAEKFHQKYKRKYLQRENTALLYKYETNSSTVTTP